MEIFNDYKEFPLLFGIYAKIWELNVLLFNEYVLMNK